MSRVYAVTSNRPIKILLKEIMVMKSVIGDFISMNYI